jgi:hypothetical protein
MLYAVEDENAEIADILAQAVDASAQEAAVLTPGDCDIDAFH